MASMNGRRRLHVAEIAIEPAENFADERRSLQRHVPRFQYEVTLMARGGAKQLKHRRLRRHERKEEIIRAVQHQRWDSDAGQEIQGINFRRPMPGVWPAANSTLALNRGSCAVMIGPIPAPLLMP